MAVVDRWAKSFSLFEKGGFIGPVATKVLLMGSEVGKDTKPIDTTKAAYEALVMVAIS